jgi:C1A family cysteine protease
MAVVAAVEAVHYMNTKQSIELSVQELIDCDSENDGCEGGRCYDALAYILNNGLSSESSYPYMARGTISGCKRDKAVVAKISDYEFVEATEEALEEAVAKQPVIVSLLYTDALDSYEGGIIDALPPTLPDSNEIEPHYVLIVGYGTDSNGVPYWRFKNSWGKTWGEGGFGRIRRHVTDERGVMGMFMEPAVYPVLNT